MISITQPHINMISTSIRYSSKSLAWNQDELQEYFLSYSQLYSLAYHSQCNYTQQSLRDRTTPMHSDIIKEYEKHRNHSPVIMLLCQPNTREGDYIKNQWSCHYHELPRDLAYRVQSGISTTPTQYLSFTHGSNG